MYEMGRVAEKRSGSFYPLSILTDTKGGRMTLLKSSNISGFLAII